MKTPFLYAALLASAALLAQAQANDHRDIAGGPAIAAGPAPAGNSAPSFQGMAGRSIGGGHVIYSQKGFSPRGVYSPALRNHNVSANERVITSRSLQTRNIARGEQSLRLPDQGKPATASRTHQTARTNRVGRGTSLPSNWRTHVFAEYSGNWHQDWDRQRDHWWHGHRCRFINSSWVIFDLGFYPWWPYWSPPYYYASYYDGYPYAYAPGYYDAPVYNDEQYYAQADTGSDATSTVAAAQERLRQQSYYRGRIDGILGPETRRAIVQYQSAHGLRVSGYLTNDTLNALGLS